MIEFHLDAGSGLPPYQQLVRQVRHALRLGLLREGDQLPTVKDVVAQLAINPNTVLKAYRELEHDGLVAARPGVGTFVMRTLTDATLVAHGPLRQDLLRWLGRARRAGLDDESIGLAAITAAALAGFAVEWWSEPLDKAAADDFARIGPMLFGTRGIVPMAYAAFAFALGVTVGMLVRRTVAAMAITLAVFVAVQLAIPQLVRPNLIAPVRSTMGLSKTSSARGGGIAALLQPPARTPDKRPCGGTDVRRRMWEPACTRTDAPARHAWLSGAPRDRRPR